VKAAKPAWAFHEENRARFNVPRASWLTPPSGAGALSPGSPRARPRAQAAIRGCVSAAEEPGWVSYDMGLCLGSGGARLGQL